MKTNGQQMTYDELSDAHRKALERENVLMGFLYEAKHICTRIVLRCPPIMETADMKETALMAYKFDIKTGVWLGDLNEARRKAMKEEGK